MVTAPIRPIINMVGIAPNRTTATDTTTNRTRMINNWSGFGSFMSQFGLDHKNQVIIAAIHIIVACVNIKNIL